MVTIYDAEPKVEPRFWDVYEGERTIGNVLEAAKKLFDQKSPTVYREDADGMGTMQIQEMIDIRPECVDELVKRFGDRPFPKISSGYKKGCPDDQAHGLYLQAIEGKRDMPADEMRRLEGHFGECDPCMIDLMAVYSYMMIDDDKYTQRLMSELVEPDL